jgi:rubrerythrin
MTRAMTSLLEPPLRVPADADELVEWLGFGERGYRCPRCGGVEHTDSELPGTCPVCPGLVELRPAPGA